MAILALAAGFTACQEDAPEYDKVISIEIKDTGEDFVVAYISPPSTAASFKYAIGMTSDVEIFKNGTLSGIVTKNGNAPQTVTFTKYSGNKLRDNFTYYVMAASYDADGNLLSGVRKQPAQTTGSYTGIYIDIDGIGETEVTATITPGSNTIQYNYAIGFTGDYEEFLNDEMSGIKKVVSGDDKNPTLLFKTTETFTGLTPGTKYAIYARSKQVDKTWKPALMIEVTTKMTTGTMYLEEKEVSDKDVTVEITKGINIGYYFYSLQKKDGSSETIFDRQVKDAIQADDFTGIVKKGIDSRQYEFEKFWGIEEVDGVDKLVEKDIEPLTEYTLYVMPVYVNNTGGPIQTLNITTTEIPDVRTDVD